MVVDTPPESFKGCLVLLFLRSVASLEIYTRKGCIHRDFVVSCVWEIKPYWSQEGTRLGFSEPPCTPSFYLGHFSTSREICAGISRSLFLLFLR